VQRGSPRAKPDRVNGVHAPGAYPAYAEDPVRKLIESLGNRHVGDVAVRNVSEDFKLLQPLELSSSAPCV
jgi:hypothetical protein